MRITLAGIAVGALGLYLVQHFTGFAVPGKTKKA